ncbi:MAG: sigma-70 family RNA polymerase sigma factor [Bacteroidales bacterium]|nr:sigma-70 family RNA polymerase sigma factor [Bacteroidales bacterium]
MSPSESEKISIAYKTEKKKLLSYISRRVPAQVEAEDILQDVFYTLTVGFRDLERIQNLTAWLYRVTDNRITDLFRKKKPLSITYTASATGGDDEPLTLEEILPSLGLTPDDEEIREMIWDTIDDTLNELPEEQRAAFILNEFEDMSFIEMSEKTGIPVNTLISRKRYAVLALRENLKELYRIFKNE